MTACTETIGPLRVPGQLRDSISACSFWKMAFNHKTCPDPKVRP